MRNPLANQQYAIEREWISFILWPGHFAEQKTATLTSATQAMLTNGSVADIAVFEGVAPILQQRLAQDNLTKNAMFRRLTAYLMREQQRMESIARMQEQFFSIISDTPVLLLKGSATRHLVYEQPNLRTMNDLDVMVDPSSIDEMVNQLVSCGFQIVARPVGESPHEVQLRFAGALLELHRYFVGSGRASSWNHLIARSEPSVYGANIARPSSTDLIWHTYQHGFRGQLRWVPWRLRDIDELRRLLALNDVDWSVVKHWTGLQRLAAKTALPVNVMNRWPELPVASVGYDRPDYPKYLHPTWLRRPSDWWLHMRHGIEGESFSHCLQAHYRDLWSNFTSHDMQLPAKYLDWQEQ